MKINNIYTKLFKEINYQDFDKVSLKIIQLKITDESVVFVFDVDITVAHKNLPSVHNQKIYYYKTLSNDILKFHNGFETKGLINTNFLKFIINNIDELINNCVDEIQLKYSKQLSEEVEYVDMYYYKIASLLIAEEAVKNNTLKDIKDENIINKMYELILNKQEAKGE